MAREQRSRNATLVTVTDDELVRHGALAYNDGYADAREYGQAGFLMPHHYSASERQNYLQGFHRGLRVHRVTTKSLPHT